MLLLQWTLALIFAVSCATNNTSIENRDIEQLYQGAGVEKYFLPDLPLWANFSSSSECNREGIVRYINFETIRDSYSLDYVEMVHMQHMLNRRFETARAESDQELYLKDEAFIFYNVYEQVIGGGRDFLAPTFPKLSLVWVDPYLSNPAEIGKILERSDVGKGHPVLVSACLNSKALEKLTEKNEWSRFGAKLLGQEMFSPYTSNNKLTHDYVLDFDKFFPGKQMTLFAPYLPKHFIGIKSIKTVK